MRIFTHARLPRDRPVPHPNSGLAGGHLAVGEDIKWQRGRKPGQKNNALVTTGRNLGYTLFSHFLVVNEIFSPRVFEAQGVSCTAGSGGLWRG